jgi:putative acetyltransferase
MFYSNGRRQSCFSDGLKYRKHSMHEVIHYPERRRFQIDINGLEAGYISYTEHNGGWDVDHTEVSPNFRNQGIARMLVDALTAYAEAHGIPLTASCDYAARFIG